MLGQEGGVIQSYAHLSAKGRLVDGESESIPHYAASLMKLPLAIAALQRLAEGEFSIDRQLVIPASYPSAASDVEFTIEGDSLDAATPPGSSSTIGMLLRRSIVVSSNEATILLLGLVGCEAVNRVYAQCGADASFVQRAVFDSAAADAGLTNVTTALDAARVVWGLWSGSVLSPEPTRWLLEVLQAQEDRELLHAGTPTGAMIGSKSGETSAVRHDCGFVVPPGRAPYFLGVCTTGLSPALAAEWIRNVALRAYRRIE